MSCYRSTDFSDVSDIDRCHRAMTDLQSKVTEKNALLNNHKGRLAQLKLKAGQLDHEDGPVQKIVRVVGEFTSLPSLVIFLCLLTMHLWLILKGKRSCARAA